MRYVIMSLFLFSVLCSGWGAGDSVLTEDELEDRKPKEVLDEQLIRTRSLQLRAEYLYKDAIKLRDTDPMESLDKLVNAHKLASLLDPGNPNIRKLGQQLSRAMDDVYVAIWSKGLKKEGASVLLQYQGDWLKTHDSNPWIVVKHTTTAPKNFRELDGYLVKDGRCHGKLEFLRVYKDFSFARLTPEWSAKFQETSGVGFKEELKGARVMAMDEKRQGVLWDLACGRISMKQVNDFLNPPVEVPLPPTPVNSVAFDGEVLSSKVFNLSNWSEHNLKAALKNATATLSDPLALKVNWYVNPADVAALKKMLESKFKIKTVAVKREEQDNPTARRIKNITLGTVSLKETRITTVLEFLKNSARSMDPEGMGVNLLYIPQGKENWKSEPTVTLSLNNVSVETYIKKICETTGLKYRVERHGVVIAKSLPKTIEIPIEYQRKYRGLTISKVSFADTRVSTVLEFLTMRCKQRDPYQVGLPLLVTLPKPPTPKEKPPVDKAKPIDDKDEPFDEIDADFGMFDDDKVGGEATISFDFDDTPAIDLLTFVCYATQLDMAFENGVIVIKPLVPTTAATK